MSFVSNIQLMMHGFGDCRRPLAETATLIETIVHQQMTSLLHQATENSVKREATHVSPEDILFIMRNDLLKLQRIINYMGVRDLYQRTTSSVSSEGFPEADVNQEISRKKMCINFLQSIDQTGKYESIFTSSLYDPVMSERNHRMDMYSQGLSIQRYKEYSEARRASFCPRMRVNKFREWLLVDDNSDIKLNQHVLEMLNFLAYETVAQIVDLALLVKRDANGSNTDLSRFLVPSTINPDYPSVLIQRSSSLQHGIDNSTKESNVGMDPITPDEVREAVRRFFSDNSPLSAYSTTRSPINQRLFAA